MSSRYAFIVGACNKYVPEINGLLNSLDYVHNRADVHLWHYNFPQDYIESIKSTDWSYDLHLHKIEEEEAREYGGVAEIVCRKRYWYAADVGKEYFSICILDADMIFVRDPYQFFKIAHKTAFIIGVHKEQNKVYNHDHHKVQNEKGFKEFIVDPKFWNDKDLCNCPIFIDAMMYERPLKRSWEIFAKGWPNTNFKAPDMDAVNLCFLEVGLYDKIIKLSNHAWLGTNESLLKPYTRAVERNGNLFTENGQEIFSFHGQFYKKKWREVQLANRSHCAKHYLGCNEKPNEQAKGAMDLLTKYFNRMCFGHKVTIEKKNYVHPELPYEE